MEILYLRLSLRLFSVKYQTKFPTLSIYTTLKPKKMRCTSINLFILALAVSSDLGANARPTDYVVLPNGELMDKRDPASGTTLAGIA
jgi:hypothetical protein